VNRAAHSPPRAGFTLVELLVAVAILLLVSTATYAVFAAATRAWQRGLALSEDLHHGDFVIEQLVMGLRSAVWRGRGDGFWLRNEGSGPYAADAISWVKAGPALIGEESEAAKSLHRIEFTVRKNPDAEKPGAAITAWGDDYLQPEEFDPSRLTPVFLSSRIVGFDCRAATNNFERETIDWQDTWEDETGPGMNLTNRLPFYVELTLYLEPLEEGEAPVAVKRCVEVPVAALSWR
jgi:prepilin-type N-terminal cleavage/methylation domain-containing protein